MLRHRIILSLYRVELTAKAISWLCKTHVLQRRRFAWNLHTTEDTLQVAHLMMINKLIKLGRINSMDLVTTIKRAILPPPKNTPYIPILNPERAHTYIVYLDLLLPIHAYYYSRPPKKSSKMITSRHDYNMNTTQATTTTLLSYVLATIRNISYTYS